MSEAIVNQLDFNRIIKTELLPYEIPYRFSFECLSDSSHPIHKYMDRIAGEIQSRRVKPIQFKISKNPLSDKTRDLTIMPPALTIKWRDFYRNYNQLILSLCNRSGWSLRRPSAIAKVFVYQSSEWNLFKDSSDNDQSGGEFTSSRMVVEADLRQDAVSSFFVYSRFNTLYQFYSSGDLRRLEKIFSYCAHADISNCFNSIYSHSISWALVGKEEAKLSAPSQQSFDSEFDLLIRNSNYGETAGILVGPEISRIFSEIILQKCDNEIERALLMEGLVDGRDYTIRRYMDDYFIFYNLPHHQGLIVRIISDVLVTYKLHLNDKKLKLMTRPFVSTISLSKKRISDAAKNFFSELVEDQKYSQSRAQWRALKFVDELRYIASEHAETFKPLVPFTLGILKKMSKKALRHAKDPRYADAALNRIVEILCVAEDLLTTCLNFRVTVVISEILYNISTSMKRLGASHSFAIEQFCSSIIYRFLLGLESNPPFCRADFYCLFITYRDIGGREKMEFDLFKKISRSNQACRDLNCVELCTAIYFYLHQEGAEDIVDSLLRSGLERVCACDNILLDTDLLCLAFDLLACPNMARSADRQKIINKLDPQGHWGPEHWRRITKSDAFFHWRSKKTPGHLLQKKSLSFGY